MLIELPNPPVNLSSNICFLRIMIFYLDFSGFLCLANCLKCALKWPLKALSEGQNQDGRPSAKIRIDLN